MTLSIETSQNRVASIDALRGSALVAMIVFHLFRDLEIFGVLGSGTTATGVWAVAARLIAGSFMFLVGMSLVLAHGGGIRLTAPKPRLRARRGDKRFPLNSTRRVDRLS